MMVSRQVVTEAATLASQRAATDVGSGERGGGGVVTCAVRCISTTNMAFMNSLILSKPSIVYNFRF